VISETFLRTEALPLLRKCKREWESNGDGVKLSGGATNGVAKYVLRLDLRLLESNGNSFRLEFIGDDSERIAIKFIEFVRNQPKPFGPDMVIMSNPGGPQSAIEVFETLVQGYRKKQAAALRRTMKLPR
jgi:hypothetical protein